MYSLSILYVLASLPFSFHVQYRGKTAGCVAYRNTNFQKNISITSMKMLFCFSMVCMTIASLAKLLKFQPFIYSIAHRSIISTSALLTSKSNFFPHQKHLLRNALELVNQLSQKIYTTFSEYIYAHNTLTRTFIDVNMSNYKEISRTSR